MHRFSFENAKYEVSNLKVCLGFSFEYHSNTLNCLHAPERETGILPNMIAPRKEWSWSALIPWRSTRRLFRKSVRYFCILHLEASFKLTCPLEGAYDQSFWISGSNFGSLYHYHWEPIGKVIGPFKNWAPDQPSNSYYGCTTLNSSESYLWHSTNISDCESQSLRYICEERST